MKTPKQKASEWIEKEAYRHLEELAYGGIVVETESIAVATINYLDELQRLNPDIKFPEFNKDENE